MRGMRHLPIQGEDVPYSIFENNYVLLSKCRRHLLITEKVWVFHEAVGLRIKVCVLMVFQFHIPYVMHTPLRILSFSKERQYIEYQNISRKLLGTDRWVEAPWQSINKI